MHEWSLFIFTLALQLSIGALSIYTLLKLVIYKDMKLLNEKIFLSVLSAFALIGLVGSFTHLGSPGNALNTINNFANSWMSKEIVFTGAFIGILVVTTVCSLTNKEKFLPAGLIAGTIIGLIDVFCMAKIYSSSLVSGWNSIHTFTSFYGAMLILGTCVILAFSLKELVNKTTNLSLIAGFILFIGVAINLLGFFFLPGSLTEVTIIGANPAIVNYEAYTNLNIFRWVTGILGLGLAFNLLFNKKAKYIPTLLYTSILLLVLAEGFGRYIFYTFVS